MSRQQRINLLISEELTPSFLLVENESFMHHVPKDAETHFKLTIVSEKFNDLSKVARHRLVNKLLMEELSLGLHALSLHLFTAEEWQTANQNTAKSPACRDGFRHG
ncbi:MAG: BolA family transcriptional regulator [Tatlockia sp.]|nr:BolA family transcriptional regulator [Tatlockia sp.]